tara:strand:- start:3211 stop:3462 length:252 start_codon:yes stop_codon:yes gene_type:complete
MKESSKLIQERLLDAQNELNNALHSAPINYSHERIQEAFSTLKFWLNKRMAYDLYTGKVDPLTNDYMLTNRSNSKNYLLTSKI